MLLRRLLVFNLNKNDYLVFYAMLSNPCCINELQYYKEKLVADQRGKIQGKIVMLLLLSRFSRVRLCATQEMEAHQAPLSMGFFRQEHWSRLPFPSPMHESEKCK